MSALINSLIDKQDTNEIVRDKIAVILATEEANQRVLAVNQNKNPNNYRFSVFIERSRPWEILTDNDGSESSYMPLINVVFDSDSFDNRGSQNLNMQRAKGIFYIDCYAHKSSTYHQSGDEATSKESDRIARLVRNIIMFGDYTYLGMQGIVTRRFINKREKLQPDIRQEGFENIIVTRLTLEVDYEEYTLEATPEILDSIFGECKLEDTGQVLFECEFDYTT